MTDDEIELVIKIPKEAYQGVVSANKVQGRWGNNLLGTLCTGIATGTPLPKGHGNLKDIDKIEQMLDVETPDNIIAKALKNLLESVPTIIEADKESEI